MGALLIFTAVAFAPTSSSAEEPREGECDPNPFPDNNIGPGTLKGAPIPEPQDLGDFVRNRAAAIALGKALFWDEQVGSDGVQACASCHFRAGADPRSRNQLATGGLDNPNQSIDLGGADYQLTAADFPLHLFADPTNRFSPVLRSFDDVVSSQGVRLAEFLSATRGLGSDQSTPLPDPVFNIHGVNTRRVEQRNTPTIINAVFNLRNFWDGRADNIFNGVNPFGARDPDARVLLRGPRGQLVWTTVRLDLSSLASQAVGPIVSEFEMAFRDRPLRDIGKRLVSAQPLAQQRVHSQDSVLASLRDHPRGLSTTYRAMIRRAFAPRWWRSNQIVIVHSDGATSFAPKPPRPLRENEYAMMEHNFSLFFGLAIQMYEGTLVSDDAKIDRHFDRLVVGRPGLLDAQELHGMELFDENGCADCHNGPEFSGAVVRTARTGFLNPDVTPAFQPPEEIERMLIGSCDVAVYDQGFYNIGVRPFEEDLGIGNLDPFGNPLSIAKLLTMDPSTVPSQELLTLTYPNIANPPFQIGERTAVEGAFKIPSLRNVSATAPYFHNGGQSTLRQVVEFYNRGGDFHDHNDAFMDLGVGALNLTSSELDDLVAFLETLTDPRVLTAAAPFDHPSLRVPEGSRNNPGRDRIIQVPAVGRQGGAVLPGFLE